MARPTASGVVGYLEPGAETVTDSAGGAPSGQPDLVESINLPAYQEGGVQWRGDDEHASAECPWRDKEWLPKQPAAFRQAAVDYFAVSGPGGMPTPTRTACPCPLRPSPSGLLGAHAALPEQCAGSPSHKSQPTPSLPSIHPATHRW